MKIIREVGIFAAMFVAMLPVPGLMIGLPYLFRHRGGESVMSALMLALMLGLFYGAGIATLADRMEQRSARPSLPK